MTINELMARRANQVADCKKFLADHSNSDGLMSADDKKVYDTMMQKVKDFTAQIETLQEMEDLENSLNAPVNQPIVNEPAAKKDEKKGTASDAYRKDFMNFIRKGVVTNVLTEGTDSEGGYLVPDEFERKLIEKLEENNAMRSLATVIKTESGSRAIPVLADGGEASWVDEEGEISDDDNEYTQVVLGAYKVATLIKITIELLEDSAFDMESHLADRLAKRIANKEEQAFCVGNGTKKPTGVFVMADTGVTSADAAKITADELIDLVYSLKAPYRKNACFLMNDATIKAVRKLKTGDGQYLWHDGLQAGEPATLLGFKVVTSQYAPTIEASANIIAFGDFSYYWIADRGNYRFQRLNELYAASDMVGFKAAHRVDGKLILSEAVKCLKMHA